jgi:glycerol uptake facilitator-like aquaporin
LLGTQEEGVPQMISRFCSRLVTCLLLACSLLGLFVFFASLFAAELIGIDRTAAPSVAPYIYHYLADFNTTAQLLAQDHDTLMTYTVTGAWAGILGAFFLALVYSVLQEQPG